MQSTTTALEGSEKQVKWAEDIRRDKFEALDKVVAYCPEIKSEIDKAVKFLTQKTSAKFWIENKDNPAITFVGYALVKLETESKVAKLDYLTRQTATTNGQVDNECFVPSNITAKNMSQFTDKQVHEIVSTYWLNESVSDAGNYEYKLAKNKGEQRTEGNITHYSTPLIRSFPPGWGAIKMSAFVVRSFKSTRNRIGGETLQIYCFVEG